MIHFDRTFVVNLDRRPDRLAAFRARFPQEPWPFGQPERVQALDGDRVAKPSWYDQQPGAWGCLRTHLRLMEDALNNEHSIFIFEDDCVFAEDFAERLPKFLEGVPEDWDMVYLGGLHRMPATHPPASVSEHVCLGRGVTTTYAYGINHRFLRKLYPLLLSAEQHHIDQMLGRLQIANTFKIYCPMPWLCGMDEGLSDICGRYYRKPHWWNYVESKKDEPLHLQHLLSRKRLADGVWRDVPLTAEQQREKVVSMVGGWFSPECGQVYRRECIKAACRNEGHRCSLVEVGCWRGRSLSYLSDLIANGTIKAHAVDTWQGNSTPTDPTHGCDVFVDFQENISKLGIDDVLSIHRAPSTEAAESFADESLDVVMIDADHEYSHVFSDLSAWWPKLKPGGVLMGHDYSEKCACPEVVGAVDDFARELGRAVAADADMWLIAKPAEVLEESAA